MIVRGIPSTIPISVGAADRGQWTRSAGMLPGDEPDDAIRGIPSLNPCRGTE